MGGGLSSTLAADAVLEEQQYSAQRRTLDAESGAVELAAGSVTHVNV